MWGRNVDMVVNASLVGAGDMAVAGGTAVAVAGGTSMAVPVGAGFIAQLQAGSQMLLIVAPPPLHVSNDLKSIKLKNPMFISGVPLLSVNIVELSM